MFSFTSDQLNALLGAYLWPFFRILALLGTAPVFGQPTVPLQVKLGLAGLLTIILIGLAVENGVFRLIEARTVQRWGMQT